MSTNANAPIHVWVLLDRSGSMASIADDVVGGFNQFLAEQRTRPGTTRVTLVQFDSEDPFEVLFDGVPLREVTDLERAAYQPRGTTPLYDAAGRLVAKVDGDVAAAAERGDEEEDQVVVLITDGQENASREHTRSTVFDLVSDRRTKGWVFVFLGANQDVYAEGGAIGVAGANRAAWAQTPDGTGKMFKDMGLSLDAHRAKPTPQRRAEADEFWHGDEEG
jgi:Mg-chelatase subunit ChlD